MERQKRPLFSFSTLLGTFLGGAGGLSLGRPWGTISSLTGALLGGVFGGALGYFIGKPKPVENINSESPAIISPANAPSGAENEEIADRHINQLTQRRATKSGLQFLK
jgi:hypothetical protein